MSLEIIYIFTAMANKTSFIDGGDGMPIKKHNEYQIVDDYVVMKTNNGYEFLIDLEDLNKVKDICWCSDKKGYLLGWDTNLKKMVKLSRLIMNCPDGLFVDHIGGNESIYDNRKQNLRICTNTQNQWNRKEAKNNTSGHKSVFWVEKNHKWMVRMCINGKRKSFGYYSDFDEACAMQEKIENQLCGEFSYDNSQNLTNSS